MNYCTTSSIKRLRNLLNQAILIKPDREYLIKIIGRMEKLPSWTKRAKKAAKALEVILNQDKVTKAKCRQRFCAKSIDLFGDNLDKFSSQEILNIVRQCHLIQMTDGCSVGCSWCYLNAKPFIEKKIVFRSYQKFIKLYGRKLPELMRLYWASDPFDWYEDDKSYVDLVREFYKVVKNSNYIMTVTSIPAGTEVTLIRYIDWLNKNFKFRANNLPSRFDPNYLKNDLISEMYYKNKTKLNVDKYFYYFINKKFVNKEARYILRFSETKKNRKRIELIFDILKFVDISANCLSQIIIEKKDIGPDRNIKKAGRAFNWGQRNILKDSLSLACWDSTVIMPNKIGTVIMCGTTSSNPSGAEFKILKPGVIKIPKGFVITNYNFNFRSKNQGKEIQFLPYAEVLTYKNGVLFKKKTHYSLKRDILAYSIALFRVLPAIKLLADTFNLDLSHFLLLREFYKDFQVRKKATDKLLKKEQTEKEVREIVKGLAEQIEDWFKINLSTSN